MLCVEHFKEISEFILNVCCVWNNSGTRLNEMFASFLDSGIFVYVSRKKTGHFKKNYKTSKRVLA